MQKRLYERQLAPFGAANVEKPGPGGDLRAKEEAGFGRASSGAVGGAVYLWTLHKDRECGTEIPALSAPKVGPSGNRMEHRWSCPQPPGAAPFRLEAAARPAVITQVAVMPGALIPAKAGIDARAMNSVLDSRFRGNDRLPNKVASEKCLLKKDLRPCNAAGRCPAIAESSVASHVNQ